MAAAAAKHDTETESSDNEETGGQQGTHRNAGPKAPKPYVCQVFDIGSDDSDGDKDNSSKSPDYAPPTNSSKRVNKCEQKRKALLEKLKKLKAEQDLIIAKYFDLADDGTLTPKKKYCWQGDIPPGKEEMAGFFAATGMICIPLENLDEDGYLRYIYGMVTELMPFKAYYLPYVTDGMIDPDGTVQVKRCIKKIKVKNPKSKREDHFWVLNRATCGDILDPKKEDDWLKIKRVFFESEWDSDVAAFFMQCFLHKTFGAMEQGASTGGPPGGTAQKTANAFNATMDNALVQAFVTSLQANIRSSGLQRSITLGPGMGDAHLFHLDLSVDFMQIIADTLEQIMRANPSLTREQAFLLMIRQVSSKGKEFHIQGKVCIEKGGLSCGIGMHLRPDVWVEVWEYINRSSTSYDPKTGTFSQKAIHKCKTDFNCDDPELMKLLDSLIHDVTVKYTCWLGFSSSAPHKHKINKSLSILIGKYVGFVTGEPSEEKIKEILEMLEKGARRLKHPSGDPTHLIPRRLEKAQGYNARLWGMTETDLRHIFEEVCGKNGKTYLMLTKDWSQLIGAGKCFPAAGQSVDPFKPKTEVGRQLACLERMEGNRQLLLAFADRYLLPDAGAYAAVEQREAVQVMPPVLGNIRPSEMPTPEPLFDLEPSARRLKRGTGAADLEPSPRPLQRGTGAGTEASPVRVDEGGS